MNKELLMQYVGEWVHQSGSNKLEALMACLGEHLDKDPDVIADRIYNHLMEDTEKLLKLADTRRKNK